MPEPGSLGDQLKQAGVVTAGEFKLRNGEEETDVYYDIKKAFGKPELVRAFADATTEKLDPRTTCIAASGHGGIPLAVMVSQSAELPLVLVRDAPKDHGRGGVIDGYVPGPGDVVTIVDDVFTSGSSLRQTAGNLTETGAEIVGCQVVVARGDVTQFEMPVSFLFTPKDLSDD